MATSDAQRISLALGLQLAILGTGLAATYDRGPIATVTAWVVGRDRGAEARARAVAEASETAQRTPANAVRGADGRTRYAVVRNSPAVRDSPRLQRERRGLRITFGILMALALWSAARRLRRSQREPLHPGAPPPNGALQQTWPVTHHGDPLSASNERSARHHARTGRPRS
jgi:hypothetical protein